MDVGGDVKCGVGDFDEKVKKYIVVMLYCVGVCCYIYWRLRSGLW